MLHNYAPWGGLESYRRGVTITNLWGVKMGKKLEYALEGIKLIEGE